MAEIRIVPPAIYVLHQSLTGLDYWHQETLARLKDELVRDPHNVADSVIVLADALDAARTHICRTLADYSGLLQPDAATDDSTPYNPDDDPPDLDARPLIVFTTTERKMSR